MPTFPAGVHLIGGQNAAITHREMAGEFYRPLVPVVVELRAAGLSLRGIARELERRGIKTRYEFQRWDATQVQRILARPRADV